MMKGNWTLINYFDVWGNEDDGWEVNDLCVERRNIDLPENDSEIVDFLIEIRFIPNFKEIIRLDWTDDGWCEIVCDADERPLGRLVKEVR